MTIRALCTDIDGTLLDSNRQLSRGTIAAFHKIPRSIPIILASSRMPSALVHLQHELNIVDHPLVCYNGGYVIQNGHRPRVFTSVCIPVATCASILDMTQGTSIHVSLYTEDEWHAPALDYWTDREQRITKVKAMINTGEAVIAGWSTNHTGAHKVMCMGAEPEIHELEKQLRQSLSEQIHIYRSRPTYLELAPKSVSKATGLRLILKETYDIRMEDVMAFGDNYNDIDLLQSVGLGIAVGNALDEVKVVAHEVTGKSTDDGVAQAIHRYF